MRRITLTCFAFASLAAASCSSNQSGLPEGPAAESAAPIVYGTADTTHTAVVAILNPDQGGYDQCSGTIVQVTNGVGYVLTAGHCCSPAPTVVILNSDYSVGVPYINSSNPPAPTYAVNAGSVKVDPAYVPTTTHDFCMFTFNGAPAGTPVIPVATAPDGLALNTTVEYVGFGVTTDATNNSNTLRYHASAPVNLAVAADTFSYNEGGGIGGPCEGDSGGPALLPSGAAQSTQRVVGTTSYGSSKCQPTGSTGVDMRVTSATGPGGFITTFLGGSSSSSSSSSSSTSSSSSSGGTAPTTCSDADGTVGCCEGNVNYYCAAGSTTVTATTCTGTKVCGWNASKGYYACVAAPGGTAPGDSPPIQCGGSSATTSSSSSTSTSTSTSGSVTTSSSSSSSGTTSCGLTTGDPTCDACINGSCCAQATACANDANCIPCLQANPICTNDPAATDFNNCLGTSCVAACSGGGTGGGGAGGGSTTTTGTATTGTGAGNTTGTGTGTTTSGGNGGSSNTTSGSIVGAGGGSAGNGGNGTGNSGTGTGNNGTSGGLGNSPGNNSGCNVASGGSSNPSAPTSLAGMLLGAALVFSRRRR